MFNTSDLPCFFQFEHQPQVYNLSQHLLIVGENLMDTYSFDAFEQ